MKIIALNGHKNCGKVKLAEKWDKNENVTYVKPYSDKRDIENYIWMDKDDLKFMVNNNIPVASRIINEHIYSFFDEQFINDYCVVCVDDDIMKQFLASDYDVITVFVDNPKAEKSDRVETLYPKSSYYAVYNYGFDDAGEFLEQLAFDLELVQS